ncbi:O-methyltransferase [Defluviitalea phaphyphila]|uniref:O-methyltransferase n=1 Tax=Defluviitalea phaphyphila TaxID=1473580 RepID=UPI0007312466|nr:O-methyltransferase [Defluviitalea phaphyphila]
MSEINYDYINSFIRDMIPKDLSIVGKIEDEARKNNMPIIQKEVARLISVLLSIKKPKKILEIGTAVGYSSILMSKYLQPGGKIITIERYDIMQKAAKENIKRAGLENIINIIENDAEEVLPNLEESFDVIFIDAAKGQYNTFLPHCIRLLNEEGLIIADNVLHKGMIAKSRYDIPRRQRTIHKRMRNFLWEIMNNPSLESCVLPMGDGVALCHKINRKEEIND